MISSSNCGVAFTRPRSPHRSRWHFRSSAGHLFILLDYVPIMAKDEVDALKKWREAEKAYADSLSPYVDAKGQAPHLKKKDLLEMVELRGKADRWREKYFRECHTRAKD